MAKTIRRTIVITIIAIMMMTSCSFAATSDYEIAQQIANDNGATVEKVITVSKGGKKGKVKGTKWTVKYPKKVKKGKKVTVYFVEQGDDIIAMVCLGKVK